MNAIFLLTPTGNDHCNESKSQDLQILNAGNTFFRATLPYSQQSYNFSEDTATSLFSTGNNYTWRVTATKGSQKVSSNNSTFQYCDALAQIVLLYQPGTKSF